MPKCASSSTVSTCSSVQYFVINRGQSTPAVRKAINALSSAHQVETRFARCRLRHNLQNASKGRRYFC